MNQEFFVLAWPNVGPTEYEAVNGVTTKLHKAIKFPTKQAARVWIDDSYGEDSVLEIVKLTLETVSKEE